MIINDRIHGEITVKEPVIERLLQTKPLVRLKGVSQDGAPHFIQPRRNVTRFEHSVGVWYLSNRFNRPIEEQIACLIHDIPHTAFSHVADFVFPNEKHEFHDSFLTEVVLKSEIPAILKEHGIDVDNVLDKGRFPLLENELPDISFDRWDYFMRDGYMIGFLPRKTIKLFMGSMFIENEQIFFVDERIASMFAILFVNFSRLIWLDPVSHASFFLLAEAVKAAIQEGVIGMEDLFLVDEDVLKKLKASNNERVNSFLKRLKPGEEFIYVPKGEAEFYGPNKLRFVDPLVKKDGELKRVSEIVPSLGYYFKELKDRYSMIGVKQVT